MKDWIICPQCKGRRSVFNTECLFLTVVFWLPMLAEADEEASSRTMSKRVCPTCRGKGIITGETE